MRRARPYRGENPEPGKDVTESLTPRPELENDQDPIGDINDRRRHSTHRRDKVSSQTLRRKMLRRDFITQFTGAATAIGRAF